MSRVATLHQRAMESCDRARLARARGESEAAVRAFRDAFRLECKAATLLAPRVDREPERSILLRSAAALGFETGEYEAARKLVGTAMEGKPPAEIAEELSSLLDEIEARLRLKTREERPAGLTVSLTSGFVRSANRVAWAAATWWVILIPSTLYVTYRAVPLVAGRLGWFADDSIRFDLASRTLKVSTGAPGDPALMDLTPERREQIETVAYLFSATKIGDLRP